MVMLGKEMGVGDVVLPTVWQALFGTSFRRRQGRRCG
jgi:hypothetical protein